MCGGLIGDGIRTHAAAHQFRKNLGCIAEKPYRNRLLIAASLIDDHQRFIETARLPVQIARAQAHLDARRLAFDCQQRCARHDCRERLRAAHASKAGGENPFTR